MANVTFKKYKDCIIKISVLQANLGWFFLLFELLDFFCYAYIYKEEIMCFTIEI